MSKEFANWTNIFKRFLYLGLIIVLTITVFKVIIFYMPFLIAFIISLLMEPAIKKLMNKFKLSRRASSIIVFTITFGIIIGLLIWGITTLISESTNLLLGLNDYYDKAYFQIQNLISKIDFNKLNLSDKIINLFQDTSVSLLNKVSNGIQEFFTKVLTLITSIPSIGIYFVITILALYFICTDKIYMLDELEHHLPDKWMKELTKHIRELIKILGGYLKAQAFLILISFLISLVGLYIFYFAGLNVGFPLLTALAIGFVDALPIVGSGTVMVPWGVVASLNGDGVLGSAIIILWIIMSIARQFLEPKIVSRKYRYTPYFYNSSNVYRL